MRLPRFLVRLLRRNRDGSDGSEALPASDDWEVIVGAIVQTQGSHAAVYHILFELTLRLALAQDDPTAFVRNMFESISSKLDQTSDEMAGKRASGEQQTTLSTFFSALEAAVRAKEEPPGPSAAVG